MNNTLEVTNFNRSRGELERFWLFCLFVAGKNADIQLRKLNQFLTRADEAGVTPFEYIRDNLLDLRNMLVAAKVGQYNRLVKAVEQSIMLDLRYCELKDLTNIFGVGPKTARFFLTHSRMDMNHVVLDVHILKWLKEHGVNVPRQTPSEPKYSEIEDIALNLFSIHFSGLTMAEVDLMIWGKMSGRIE
jgi:thermostable 8-oxoguanine DNA glycosylase